MRAHRLAILILVGLPSLACGDGESATAGTGGTDASAPDGKTDDAGDATSDANAWPDVDPKLDAAGDAPCFPPCDAGDAGSDAAPDAPVPDGGLLCESGETLGSFTVTQAQQSMRIKLPLTPGVVYRRLTLSFRYTPTQWSPTCNNPAASSPAGFPAFESWVALKRGTHWCKGGGLFDATLQGPAPGHGASNKASAETFYKEQVHTGSGCGTTDIESKIFSQKHGVVPGQTYDAQIVYDAIAGTLTADTGASVHEGPVEPGAQLVTTDAANDGWYVVLSFDGGFLECYNELGEEDPTASCCWLPSLGWVYQDLTWEACH